MSKKYILSLLTPLLFASLIGCSTNEDNPSNKARLTYGTEIQQDLSTLKELSNQDLYNKSFNEQEVFLLAVYQGGYSEDCLCWSTFKNTIVNYMNKWNEIVYIYDAQKQDDSLKELTIEKYNESTPCLYIFDGKEKLACFSYNNKNDKKIFEDTKECKVIKERIHEVVNRPLLHYVYPDFVQHNEIKYHSSLLFLFIRSGCGDCKYVIPNVIIPYINSHDLEIGIRIVDLQPLYDLSKKEDATEEEKGQYQEMKDLCHLSEKGARGYGYSNGVVPTLQYYKTGGLEDACVYFNDEISQKDDGSYYVSNSFYTEERLTSLKYVDNVKNKVLKGLSLSSDDVAKTSSGYTYWLQEKAAQYHTPLLEAFLDYYCRQFLNTNEPL